MNRKYIIVFFFTAMCCFTGVYFVSIFLGSCNPQKARQNNTNNTSPEIKTITPPDFKADSAYYFTQQQVNFGPRIPGTPAQIKCAQWLTFQLKRFCKNVTVQEGEVKIYTGKMVPMK